MFVVYIDDSGDEKMRCFSALLVHETVWKQVHDTLRSYRRDLKASDGILVTREFHATEFVAGRGRLGPRVVAKGRRCAIFRQTLALITSLPGIRLINAVSSRVNERMVFERLLVRIQRTMEERQSRAILIHDEGKDYTPLLRKLRVFNPVPSQHGVWPDGKKFRNFPTDRIIEDIVFRKSNESPMIQMADFCAYALFRSEAPRYAEPRYDLRAAFDILHPICLKEASHQDVRGLGIIRAPSR